MTTAQYIAENELRKKKLFPYYDPITGAGSPIPRFPVKLNDKTTIYLPDVIKPMFPDELCKDLPKFCKENDIEVSEMLVYVEQVRYDFDFEYYAAKTQKIKDKRSGKDIWFKLNAPQRLVHTDVNAKMFGNLPVRIDILKSRKWGGSTYVQMLFNWIQNRIKTGWNSCIVTDVEDQARGLRGMTTKFAKHYPPGLGTIVLSPFEGSTKNKYIESRDCIISIGSMQRPDSLRSGTTYLEHLSEIGLWKATLGKKPEDLIQTLLEMVMEEPWTCIFRESTAKGTGTYFEKIWLQDIKGDSNYTPIFIPWFIEETNTKPIKDIEKFIASWNDYDKFCWKEGATLEGINWYKTKLRDYTGDIWRMQSENPTTATEAFQSSGNRVFRQEDVAKARTNNCNPYFIGDLIGDAPKGKECFKNINFVDNPKGSLRIWAKPDTEQKIANRYLVSMDIGGRWEGADWSVMRVFDRYELLSGGVPEAVATYCAHIDFDLLAWRGAQLAYWYNKALFVPESNSLDKEGTEGDQGLTILNEIAKQYDNLYCRTSPEKIRQGVPAMYGFHTNVKTKPAIISTLNASWRDTEYIEYDANVLNEGDSYETKPDGSYGAVDGANDDHLMATAIGMAVSNEMPRPYRVEEKQPKNIRAVNKSEAVL
jgi:hypothetical protein